MSNTNKPMDILRKLLPRMDLAYRSKEWLQARGYQRVQFAARPYCVTALHPRTGRPVKVIAAPATLNTLAPVMDVLTRPECEADCRAGATILLLLHGRAGGVVAFTAADYEPREVRL